MKQGYKIYRDFDECGNISYTVYSRQVTDFIYEGQYLPDDEFIKQLENAGIRITEGIDNRE